MHGDMPQKVGADRVGQRGMGVLCVLHTAANVEVVACFVCLGMSGILCVATCGALVTVEPAAGCVVGYDVPIKPTVTHLADKCSHQQPLVTQYLMTPTPFTPPSPPRVMPPQEREAIMAEFREGNSRVLISTDVWARGLDVQQVGPADPARNL